MEILSAFLNMGGHGGFVWPAYGLALVVMAALLIASIRAARGREAELEQVQKTRRTRKPEADTP